MQTDHQRNVVFTIRRYFMNVWKYGLAMLLASLFTPAHADDGEVSSAEMCQRARAEHESNDIRSADLSISLARYLAEKEGVAMPVWCQKHYREVLLKGLTYALQKFEAGYGNDWNSAWNEIPWIEHSARELNVTLPPTFHAKTIVVNARNEEIRQHFISLCTPTMRCRIRD